MDKKWDLIEVQKKKEDNEYFDNELYFKLVNKQNSEEHEYYKIIKKERNEILKKILDFLKEGNDTVELDKLKAEIEKEEKGEKGEKGDLFYRILNGKKGICEEIFNNINKKKEYSNFQIISAFEKIKEEEKKEEEKKEEEKKEEEKKEEEKKEEEKKEEEKTEEEKKEEEKKEEPTMSLLQAYYIKLWCFNFISFYYPCKEEYLEKIKEKIKEKFKTEEELNDYCLKEKERIIILQKGETLFKDKVREELSKLRDGDKKNFQKLIQHIIKQLSIGLYLIHHLTNSESLFHNDLKPDNALIIIDENETDLYKKYMNSTIKVVDLDLTRKINREQLNKDFYKKMYKEDLFPYDDPDKEEIFELGEIMFELLTGEIFIKQSFDYKKCQIRIKLELCENIIRFLHSTLKTDRAYRISCDEAFEHEFLIEDKEESFNQFNFNEIPDDLISEDREYFYLPLDYRFLNLNKWKMIIEEACTVEEF